MGRDFCQASKYLFSELLGHIEKLKGVQTMEE